MTYHNLSHAGLFFLFLFFFFQKMFSKFKKFWEMTLWKTFPRIGHVSGATTECFWLCPFQATDRQKRWTETDIRTNRRTSRHTDRRVLGQKRGKTDKTETETRGKEQQTRIKRQDGRQGRWCGMVYTATCGAVMVGGWLLLLLLLCCLVVCCWWCCVFCSCCLLVSCWGLLSGRRLPPPPPLRWLFAISSLEVAAIPLLKWLKVPKTPGATPEDSTGQDGVRPVCSMFIFMFN